MAIPTTQYARGIFHKALSKFLEAPPQEQVQRTFEMLDAQRKFYDLFRVNPPPETVTTVEDNQPQEKAKNGSDLKGHR